MEGIFSSRELFRYKRKFFGNSNGKKNIKNISLKCVLKFSIDIVFNHSIFSSQQNKFSFFVTYFGINLLNIKYLSQNMIIFNLLKLLSLISLRLFFLDHLKEEEKRIICLQLNTVIGKEKK